MSKKLFVVFGFVVLFISCSHFDQLQKNPRESTTGQEKSHNTGENCGRCHNSNTNGAGSDKWWTISGTVYTKDHMPQTNAIIEIWELPGKQGKLIKRLHSDKDGNFYTNQILNFSAGVYPVIMVDTSHIEMKPIFSGGSCNGCHGITSKLLQIN